MYIDAEKCLLFTNTLTLHNTTMNNRYTWARGKERSLIDYTAANNSMQQMALKEWVARGALNDSDYFKVVATVRMKGIDM